MNALASYLRHIIVTGLVIAVEKLGLPTEGLAEGADVVAPGRCRHVVLAGGQIPRSIPQAVHLAADRPLRDSDDRPAFLRGIILDLWTSAG